MVSGGLKPSAVALTRTFGSQKGRRAAITLLLLALTAKSVQYAYRAWKKPFFSTPTTTDSACSGDFHPKNVQDYGKGSPRKARNLHLSDLNRQNPRLDPFQRPGFFQPYPHNRPLTDKERSLEESWRKIYPTGLNWPSKGKPYDW
jgi:hypothetical protein